MKLISLFLRNVRGSAAIMFAITAPAVIMVSGAASMYGFEVKTKSGLQAAIDSGVLAGTALGASATEAQRIAAAIAAYEQNFRGNGTFVTDDSDYWVEGGNAPKFTANKWVVTGAAVANVRNPFSGVVGEEWLNVGSLASANKLQSDPVCLLGLNSNGAETIDMRGQSVIKADGCAVQTNSSDISGLNQQGSPSLSASMIGTTGGYTGTGYDPQPMKGTIPVEDPYKDVAFPSSSSCDYHNKKVITGTVTLTPGVYCGGLTVHAGASVTLKPGIYVMMDGPLWMNSTSQLNGQEVMIGFTGNKAAMSLEANSQINVTSPISGTYMNMQFMQEPDTGGDNLEFSILGGSTLTYDGALYLPTQDLLVGGNSVIAASSPSYAMVAEKIRVQDQGVIDISYANMRDLEVASAGSFGYGARLTK